MIKDKAPSSISQRLSVWIQAWQKLQFKTRILIIIPVIAIIVTCCGAVFTPIIEELAKIFVPRALATHTPAASSSAITTPLNSTNTPLPCAVPYPPRYGFECGQDGWEKTDYVQERQAVEMLTTTQVMNRDGSNSVVLAITADFTGSKGDREAAYRTSCEVQVNLNNFPPAGYETNVVDLSGKVVTAWIWASTGSTGDLSHKNGVQLFVKDVKNRNCYGKWINIEPEESWFRIYWRETDAAECDAGFDSSQPKILGLMIALGDNAVVNYDKLLTIYLDDIDW